MPPRPTRTTSAGTGRRPWPGITSANGRPDCYYCSWAWRGELGRMEVKFANAACPTYAHSHVPTPP